MACTRPEHQEDIIALTTLVLRKIKSSNCGRCKLSLTVISIATLVKLATSAPGLMSCSIRQRGGPMSAARSIQLDVALSYQQAVISTVRCALRQTHGADFAAGFVSEYREAIMVAALWRLCGHSERIEESTASRLGLVENM